MIVSGFPLLLAASVFASAASDSFRLPSLPDSVVLLPEVRVTRTRPSAKALQPTGFVTVLDARSRGSAVSSPPHALDQAAGVRVLQYGGLGAFSTVTLRGAPASQVGVLVDGEPLQSAARSVVSLGDLPGAAIERIEVFRGGAPLGFGLPAPAGVVNFVTRTLRDGIEGHLARGSFGTWEARLRGGGARGPFAVSANAGYQESGGDFDFFDDNGTPLNAADDTIGPRRNNRFEATHAIATIAWQAPGMHIEASPSWFHKRQGFPGVGAIASPRAGQELERHGTRVTIARDAARAWPALTVRAGVRRERSQFHDLGGDLGLGRVATDDRFAGEDASLESAWGSTAGVASVRIAGSWRGERAEPRNASDPWADPPRSTRDARGLALSVHVRPWTSRLQLHAGRRWDRIEDRLHALGTAGTKVALEHDRDLATPQYGARATLARWLELRTNWSDGRRVPEFLELFGNQGSVLGNPVLAPERTRTWDAGAAATLHREGRTIVALEYAHFATRAENLILFRRSGAGVKAFNVARARIDGDELSATVGPIAGFGVTAAWTGQRAIDDGTWAPWTGKRLPGRPDSRLYARVTAAWRRWSAFADADALGASWLDPSNRNAVPARTLIGAGASLPLAAELRVVVEGRNLGDERASDVAGYPLPGRTLFVAMDARWGGGADP